MYIDGLQIPYDIDMVKTKEAQLSIYFIHRTSNQTVQTSRIGYTKGCTSSKAKQ